MLGGSFFMKLLQKETQRFKLEAISWIFMSSMYTIRDLLM